MLMCSVVNRLIAKKINLYIELMRLDKPIGIYLLLWPTLWSLWIASGGEPNWIVVLIFYLGTIIMRSAGCVINDLADMKIDPLVDRTKNRPLAKGSLSKNEALLLFIFLIFIGFCLVLLLNRLSLYIAIFGAIITIFYPFSKRFFPAPQLFLGIAFSLGVPIAFVSQTNSMPLISWIIFLCTIVWIIFYDTQYAMADKKYDLKINIGSTAILFGDYERLFIFIMQLIFLGFLVAIGIVQSFNFLYFLSILFSSFLLIYQVFLIKDRDPKRCIRAFKNNNLVGAIIFAGIISSYSF